MENYLETTKQAGHTDELDRLRGLHDVVKDCMGTLVYAPVDISKPEVRILDSAGADGTWLLDLKSPGELVGTDIESELFPQNLPAKMKLFKQDMREPWPSELQNSFDLVNQKLSLAGSAGFGADKVIKNLATLVKPGGWLQVLELNVFTPPLSGPAHNDWHRLVRDILIANGVGDTANSLKSSFDAAGLRSVQEKKFTVCYGPKAKPELREKSLKAVLGSVAPLIAVAKGRKTSFTSEELDALPKRLEEELREYGAESEMIAVCGQKM